MLGGHNPNVSLLPDNPGVKIEAQSGGAIEGIQPEETRAESWKIIPIEITQNASMPNLSVTPVSAPMQGHFSVHRIYDPFVYI